MVQDVSLTSPCAPAAPVRSRVIVVWRFNALIVTEQELVGMKILLVSVEEQCLTQ
jgi:hypothetical protein